MAELMTEEHASLCIGHLVKRDSTVHTCFSYFVIAFGARRGEDVCDPGFDERFNSVNERKETI